VVRLSLLDKQVAHYEVHYLVQISSKAHSNPLNDYTNRCTNPTSHKKKWKKLAREVTPSATVVMNELVDRRPILDLAELKGYKNNT